MSSVIDRIRKGTWNSENFPNRSIEENMITSSTKTSRLKVKEGKGKDGSKIALVSLIEEPADVDKCIEEIQARGGTNIRRMDIKSKPKIREISPNSKSIDPIQVYKSEVSLTITHYEDPCTFWAQDHCDVDNIAAIERFLDKYKHKPVPVTESLNTVDLYIIVNEQYKKLTRCKIIQFMAEQNYLVHNIDFGNCEIVHEREILWCPVELLKYSPMAKNYRLYGLRPHTGLKANAIHEEGIRFLRLLIQNVLVYGRVFKNQVSDLMLIQIQIQGHDLGDEIVKRKFAVRVKYTRPYSEERDSRESYGSIFEPQSGGDDETNPKIKNKEVALEKQVLELEKCVMVLMAQRNEAQSEAAAYKKQLDSKQIQRSKVSDADGNFYCQLNSLLEQLVEVRSLRKQISFDDSEPDVIENILTIVNQQTEQFNLSDVIEVIGINKASADYNAAQQEISACNDIGKLPSLTVTRDAARVKLHSAISQFVNDIANTSLDKRLIDLREWKQVLNELYGEYLQIKSVNSSSLETLKIRYHEWKEKNKPMFIKMRQQTNVYHHALIYAWNRIQQALLWSVDVDPLPFRHSELLTQMHVLKDACVKELEECNLKKIDGIMIVAMLTQKLHSVLEDEIHQIQDIKNVQVEYSLMINVLNPWLGKMPDFSPLLNLDQEIKGLKSQLRHKLADFNDLEEGLIVKPVENYSFSEQIKNDLTSIRNKLHVAFATVDRLSANFAQLSKVHYPELRLLYPSLNPEKINANIVKEGRELIYYDVEPLNLVDGNITVYKTRILDKEFVLKEYALDTISMNEFVDRVFYYVNLSCSELVPITAILCPKDKKKLYVQMPYYEHNLLERNISTPMLLEAKCRNVISLAKGLAKLHAHNIIHGALHPRNVLFSDDDVILAPYNFSTNLYQRVSTALKAKPENGISFLAPELISNRKRSSTSADMYTLGCIALSIFYPGVIFENDKYKMPNYEILEETPFRRFVSKLLDQDPENRMTAEQVAICPELQNPYRVLQPLQMIEPMAECEKSMLIPFVFTEEERRDVIDCVRRFNVNEIMQDDNVNDDENC